MSSTPFFAGDIIAVLILLFALYILLRPMISGAIYFPTTGANIEIIREFAEIKSGDTIADLGSGDGRIVIALAKAGAETHGYEINPILVWHSRRAIRLLGLERKAIIHWQSFWNANLGKYNTVVVYGFPTIMKKLELKLERELAPDAKIISNLFRFSNLKGVKRKNSVGLYASHR